MTAGGAHVEPGRQVERTALSRQRTAVGVATNAALMLHVGASTAGAGLVLGAAALIAAIALWAVSTSVGLPGHGQRWRALASRPTTAAAVVVVVSLADLALVLAAS